MAHHGNTPAAWTGVLIILVGFVVGGIGLVIDSWPMFWVGVVHRRPSARSSARSCSEMGLGAEPAPTDAALTVTRPRSRCADAAQPLAAGQRAASCSPAACSARACCCTCATRTRAAAGATAPGCCSPAPTARAAAACAPSTTSPTATSSAAASSNLLLRRRPLPVLALWWRASLLDGWRGRTRPVGRTPRAWPVAVVAARRRPLVFCGGAQPAGRRLAGALSRPGGVPGVERRSVNVTPLTSSTTREHRIHDARPMMPRTKPAWAMPAAGLSRRRWRVDLPLGGAAEDDRRRCRPGRRRAAEAEDAE